MVIKLLLLSIAAEGFVYLLPFLWRKRKYAIGIALVLTALTPLATVVHYSSFVGVLVALISVFRIINQLRIAQNRMHEQYLRHETRRTGLILGVIQLLGLVLIGASWPNDAELLSIYAAIQVLFAATLLLVTLRNISKIKFRPGENHYSDKELPTVTVAIPARNETKELESCLRSVIANDYPKLEIIVLDDCSQDKTAEVIRSFAHAGVRFVKGAEPSSRWLAKNQAYDRLADEATGELILFCGVDVRLGPQVVRSLVTVLLDRQKDMISVLPRRLTSEVLSVFVQPLRYWWEIAPPRRLFSRPAVLSTCWMIRRKRLKKLGGFDAVSHSILPEGYFARELVKTDSYSFLRADDMLDVQTSKSPAAQRQTAIRMRYPQIRRRPEIALLLTLLNTMFLLAPYGLLLSAFWLGFGGVQMAGFVTAGLLTLTHVSIVQISNPANVLAAMLSFPIAILVELGISFESMYRYEFSKVDWRGRNICIPVMHVIPHLPSVDKTKS